MSAFTNYLEDALLNHTLRNVAYTSPTNVWVALFTTPTTEGGGGTEVAGGSYARIPAVVLAGNFGGFTAPSGGACSNTNDIVFPTATAGWGTVTHAAIMDASVAGNMLYHGPLAASKTVNNGDTLRFLSGSFVVGLN